MRQGSNRQWIQWLATGLACGAVLYQQYKKRSSVKEGSIHIIRALGLQDLEVYVITRNHLGMGYAIIEDTKAPYTEADLQLDPLCYMDEEDLNAVENVFQVYILSDQRLTADESEDIRQFFGDYLDRAMPINFIIREFVDEQLYIYADDRECVTGYQKMLEAVGSTYRIGEIPRDRWKYLSQDSPV